jgi:superfamily I DNA/RNA helicase/RecB family exonuclease
MAASFTPDERQRIVLAHEGGAMLVTGPAGSGKTAALIERFARLIEGAADPQRVALVLGSTGARARARALMWDRLDVSLPALHVVTAHGLARHVLMERFGELGYAEPPEVLSATDQFALVQELLGAEDPAEWPAFGAMLRLRGFADEIRQFLSRAQESLLAPEELEDRAAERGLTGWLELARFLREYQDVLAARGQVDFAGSLQQAALVAGKGEPLFDHVLVDDYQDATLATEEMLLGLAARDLVVAGDPEAHVFSFQGTTPLPLSRFAERFAPATRVVLEGSHRAPEPPLVEAWVSAHTSEEHAAIARELRRLHVEEEVPWEQLAVVVRRQGAHLGGLLRALDDAGVPRTVPERGLALASEPATAPYALALRWIVASPKERDGLVEQLLSSDLIGLSPGVARGLMRAAWSAERSVAAALTRDDGLTREEAETLAAVRDALEAAERVSASVLDAFEILWHRLPLSARLVARAESSPEARRDLDAVVALARVVEEAGTGRDPTVEGFVEALDAGQHGPGHTPVESGGGGAVEVLTAHGAVGREFHTVFIANATEGNFPSLSRPEPMFDLAVLDGPVSRSERNKERLEDERRLFRTVIARARRRVVAAASDTHPDELSIRSRFVDELGVRWQPAPTGPFTGPVSVREAAALWRRELADMSRPRAVRLAALEGLVALGVDPSRWWFQRDWTDTGRPLHERIHLSFSRMEKLDNCELQHVLADELGLGRPGGYHAWVGKTIHSIVEAVERGEIAREPDAIVEALEARWRPQEFPSLAVSDAFRRLARERMLRHWFERYADRPALAIEQGFEFELDGATITGYIDRIGPNLQGGTTITDFKTGKPDRAGKPEDNIQLGIYYLAVKDSDALAAFRPVKKVELAFLRGDWTDPETVATRMWPIRERGEETYERKMRERIAALVERKKELTATEVYRPNPYADCHWCDFKSLCPLFPEGCEPLTDEEVAIR